MTPSPPRFGGKIDDAADPTVDDPRNPATCPTCGQALPDGEPIAASDAKAGDTIRPVQRERACMVQSNIPTTHGGEPARKLLLQFSTGESVEWYVDPSHTVWRVAK